MHSSDARSHWSSGLIGVTRCRLYVAYWCPAMLVGVCDTLHTHSRAAGTRRAERASQVEPQCAQSGMGGCMRDMLCCPSVFCAVNGLPAGQGTLKSASRCRQRRCG